MITYEYFANILISISLVGLFLFYKKVYGFWLNPTCLLICFWMLYVILPVVIVINGPINPFALIYIFFFLFFFGLSSFFFKWGMARKKNEDKKNISYSIYSSGIVKFLFYMLFLISIFSNFYFLQLQGIPVSDVISSPAKVGSIIAVMRYEDNLNVDAITKLSNFSIYFLVYFGGVLYAFDSRKIRYVILTFIPVIVILIFQSSKGILFISMFVFYGCTLIKNIKNNDLNFFSFKIFFRTLIVFSVLTFLLALSFLSRGLSDLSNSEQFSMLYKFFASYSSGHLYGFSAWFSDRYFNDFSNLFVQRDFELGLFTFKSLFSLLGAGQDLSMGIYDEYIGVNSSDLSISVYSQFDYADGFIITNIYTIFRGLITDFTILGSIILAFIFGFVINCVFYNTLTKPRPFFSYVLIPFYLAISYQTFVISSFTWLTIPVAIILICCIVFVFDYLLLRKKQVV